MTPIRIAQVVPGTESPAVEGSTGAVRCTLSLDDGQRRAAVLKRGALGEVAAEAFCAVLLRAWQLPVPEPFLVREAQGLAFASADATYPSLRKRLGLDALAPGPQLDAAVRVASLLATSLPTAGLAAAADEAIANRDRNLGNILWDGSAEAWIDHAYSLGVQSPTPLADLNKLCVMATHVGTHEALRKSAVAQALTLDRGAPNFAAGGIPPELSGEPLAAAVAGRLGRLAGLLLDRFPKPADLLSGL